MKGQLRVGPPWSCIIFAEQKIACLAIASLLEACQEMLGFLQCAHLMGAGDRLASLSQSITVCTFEASPCNTCEAYSPSPPVTGACILLYLVKLEAAPRDNLIVQRGVLMLSINHLHGMRECIRQRWKHFLLFLQMQMSTLARFKNGDINALIATAVAEEGLDICHCSLIVRFSLPPTARQFIQSRGRARAPGSTMVLMLERGVASHLNLVEDAHRYLDCHMLFFRLACTRRREQHCINIHCDWEADSCSVREHVRGVLLTCQICLCRMEAEMLEEAQRRMKVLGSTDEQDCTEREIQTVHPSAREYVVQSTRAKVTLASAKGLLHKFCCHLPSDW